MTAQPAPFLDVLDPLTELRTLILHFAGPAPLAATAPLPTWFNEIRGAQATQPVLHPRLNLFVGAASGLNPADQAKHHIVMSNVGARDGPLAGMCSIANADLKVYDLSVDDSVMTAETMTRAMAYGMLAVEQGVDLFAATAISAGLSTTIEKLNTATAPDPLERLQEYGTPNLAALMGLVVGTGLAKKPLLLEGDAGLCVTRLIHALNPALIRHVALVLKTPDDAAMSPPCPVSFADLDPDVPGLGLAAAMRTLNP